MVAADKAKPGCMCAQHFCGHEAGQRCGKPVGKVVLKMATMTAPSQFGPERDYGFCDDCWKAIQQHFPIKC